MNTGHGRKLACHNDIVGITRFSFRGFANDRTPAVTLQIFGYTMRVDLRSRDAHAATFFAALPLGDSRSRGFRVRDPLVYPTLLFPQIHVFTQHDAFVVLERRSFSSLS